MEQEQSEEQVVECGCVTWDVCAIERKEIAPTIVSNRYEGLDNDEHFRKPKTTSDFGNMAKVKLVGKNQKIRKSSDRAPVSLCGYGSAPGGSAEGNKLCGVWREPAQEPRLGTTANEARQAPNLRGCRGDEGGGGDKSEIQNLDDLYLDENVLKLSESDFG